MWVPLDVRVRRTGLRRHGKQQDTVRYPKTHPSRLWIILSAPHNPPIVRQVTETERSRRKRPPCLVIRAVSEEHVLLAEWPTSLGPAVPGVPKAYAFFFSFYFF
ncbi:hypothetical protein BHE74_00047229 [Ensete ventricosum]|nr:hypothetical protein GW17_00029461 [Ensete ventricosum]RWW46825.1 hypothetical protein BHE74_00047229 [Ensete ventricosum]RZR79271.1 hypothetical protein BHM03_00004955 [Ensete ventricosum]